MIAPTSAQAAKSRQATSGDRANAAGRYGLIVWSLAIGTALALLLAAYFFQRSQPVCGDQLDPPPPAFSGDWWKCPAEENRHNRVVGSIGAAHLIGVHFTADGQRGWAVGDEGTILATRDGGQGWQPLASGVRSFLQSVHFTADGQRGWAVGGQGTILATRDGGQSWQPQASGVRNIQIGRASCRERV